MKWHNTLRDKLPEKSGKVLISHKGVYYLAFFHGEKNQFQVADEGKNLFLKASQDLYWSELDLSESRQTLSILLIEDDADDRDMLSAELKSWNSDIAVESVPDGKAALDYLFRRGEFSDRRTPDAVLLDLNLPVLDGFAVLEHLRKNGSIDQLPVFVVSTSRDAAQWQKALDLGARGFYSKGASPADFRKAVREICEHLV